MKNLLLAGILCFYGATLTADEFEKNYGRGVIHIEIDSNRSYVFTGGPDSAMIHHLYWQGGAWSVDHGFTWLDSSVTIPTWFQTLFLIMEGEYSRIDIIGLDSSKGYYQTALVDDKGRSLWIKKQKNISFLSWFGFYNTVASIEMQNDTTVLYNKADAKGPRVNYTSLYGKDVRIDRLHQVKGNWMEVDVILPAVGPVDGPPTRVKGWIIWRDDKKPLVTYNLMGC